MCVTSFVRMTGCGLKALAKLAVSKPCKSVQQTVQRANRIAKKVGKTDYIHNMVTSMPNRLAEVIKNKGGPTRY